MPSGSGTRLARHARRRLAGAVSGGLSQVKAGSPAPCYDARPTPRRRRVARPAEHLPPVLQHGFRPFFLLGALWAAAALGLWLAALAGAVDLPSSLEPVAWHRHEMLFGYLAAVIAAF